MCSNYTFFCITSVTNCYNVKCSLCQCIIICTRFVPPPLFLFFNSSLLWDVFIINSVEQLQTLPKTQSEIDISPFLKTKKPSIIYSIINRVEDRGFLCIDYRIEGFCVFRNGLISISY